jgi:hypothetical protein
MHDNHVARKRDEHDYIENEFGCHCNVVTQIDFGYP